MTVGVMAHCCSVNRSRLQRVSTAGAMEAIGARGQLWGWHWGLARGGHVGTSQAMGPGCLLMRLHVCSSSEPILILIRIMPR